MFAKATQPKYFAPIAELKPNAVIAGRCFRLRVKPLKNVAETAKRAGAVNKTKYTANGIVNHCADRKHYLIK